MKYNPYNNQFGNNQFGGQFNNAPYNNGNQFGGQFNNAPQNFNNVPYNNQFSGNGYQQPNNSYNQFGGNGYQQSNYSGNQFSGGNNSDNNYGGNQFSGGNNPYNNYGGGQYGGNYNPQPNGGGQFGSYNPQSTNFNVDYGRNNLQSSGVYFQGPAYNLPTIPFGNATYPTAYGNPESVTNVNSDKAKKKAKKAERKARKAEKAEQAAKEEKLAKKAAQKQAEKEARRAEKVEQKALNDFEEFVDSVLEIFIDKAKVLSEKLSAKKSEMDVLNDKKQELEFVIFNKKSDLDEAERSISRNNGASSKAREELSKYERQVREEGVTLDPSWSNALKKRVATTESGRSVAERSSKKITEELDVLNKQLADIKQVCKENNTLGKEIKGMALSITQTLKIIGDLYSSLSDNSNINGKLKTKIFQSILDVMNQDQDVAMQEFAINQVLETCIENGLFDSAIHIVKFAFSFGYKNIETDQIVGISIQNPKNIQDQDNYLELIKTLVIYGYCKQKSEKEIDDLLMDTGYLFNTVAVKTLLTLLSLESTYNTKELAINSIAEYATIQNPKEYTIDLKAEFAANELNVLSDTAKVFIGNTIRGKNVEVGNDTNLNNLVRELLEKDILKDLDNVEPEDGNTTELTGHNYNDNYDYGVDFVY